MILLPSSAGMPQEQGSKEATFKSPRFLLHLTLTANGAELAWFSWSVREQDQEENYSLYVNHYIKRETYLISVLLLLLLLLLLSL